MFDSQRLYIASKRRKRTARVSISAISLSEQHERSYSVMQS